MSPWLIWLLVVGIPWVYRHSNDGKGGNPQREMLEFFKKQFAAQ
jgi:hypothetical protein